MDDHRLITIGIIVVIIAGIGLSLLTPQERPPTLDETAATLKTACTSACESGDDTSAVIDIPANAGVYTTAEAICVRDGTMLSCARCPCTVIAGDLIPETMGAHGRIDASCTFIATTEDQFASEHSTITPACTVTFPE